MTSRPVFCIVRTVRDTDTDSGTQRSCGETTSRRSWMTTQSEQDLQYANEDLQDIILELRRQVVILEERLAWYRDNTKQTTLGFEG